MPLPSGWMRNQWGPVMDIFRLAIRVVVLGRYGSDPRIKSAWAACSALSSIASPFVRYRNHLDVRGVKGIAVATTPGRVYLVMASALAREEGTRASHGIEAFGPFYDRWTGSDQQ